MAETKNLCAQISLDLHRKICDTEGQAGLTTAQYITALLTEYYKMVGDSNSFAPRCSGILLDIPAVM